MKVVKIDNGHICYSEMASFLHVGDIGYRIASFLHIMRGSNSVDFLARYSEHIHDQSDDSEHLRGAIGPRIRNWIGAHQLQEMINVNSSIDEAKDYVKPTGVDQTICVHDDLRQGMTSSTLTVRDPGVDFESSKDIPDLTSITYSMLNGKEKGHRYLQCVINYQSVVSNNFQSELWAISVLSQIYHSMLSDLLTGMEMYLISCENETEFCNTWVYLEKENERACKDLSFLDDSFKTMEEQKRFWVDLDLLQNLATHIQFYLNKSTFNNPQVSTEICGNVLNDTFIEKISNRVLKDMAYSLIVWAFYTYGVNSNSVHVAQYEDQLLYILKKLSAHIQMSGGRDSFVTAELKSWLIQQDITAEMKEICSI